MCTPTTRDRVTKYSNNSNDIFQSEVIFEKIKVIKKTKKKKTNSSTRYAAETELLKRELDVKARMITKLLNTVKEIFTVNITQSAKPTPTFTFENETKANNISDMETNQSERETFTDVTLNDNIVTNSQALKMSLSEQLKYVKRQKKGEFYQFKSKQPFDNNMNKTISKLKHQALYPNGTTAIAGDSIINGVIKEKINKKDRAVKVCKFSGATVEYMEHYLIPIFQKKPSNIIYTMGQMMLGIYHHEQS